MVPPVHNLSACSYRIISIKWWIANKHLIHDCTQGPPIAFHSISFL
uniref:Uncharacterized protein n=1 Tax=Arundo donax TaxID=35708 RepID=A0A0A9DCK0_ARUDO